MKRPSGVQVGLGMGREAGGLGHPSLCPVPAPAPRVLAGSE